MRTQVYAYPTNGQPFAEDRWQPGMRIEPGVLVSADVDYDRRRARPRDRAAGPAADAAVPFAGPAVTDKAEDVLWVLADGKDPFLADLVFTVIVDAAPGRTRSGAATGEPAFWPFEKGEIIVNYDGGDREPFGEGRKPDKWDVAVESFATLAEARECQRKVLAGEWPRQYEGW